MQAGKGIPLPSIIEPIDMDCLALYIPRDEEGIYIQSMSGALSQLGKWSYHQKDGTTRAAQVAEVWREYIDLTMEIGWLSGVVMSCTEVQLLVDAINNINITLQGRECCAGGGGSGLGVEKTYRFPDQWEDDPRFSVDNPDTTPPVGDLDYMCDSAHSAYDLMRQHVNNYAQLVQEQSPYEWIFEIMVEIPLFIPAVGGLWDALVGWLGSTYTDFVTDCLQSLEDNKDLIVCAIYEASSSQDAVGRVLDVIRDNPSPVIIVSWWLETIFGSGWDYDVIFDGTFVPHITGESCVCAPSGDSLTFDFSDGVQEWGLSSRTSWNAVTERLVTHPKDGNPPDPTELILQRTDIATRLGQSDQDWTLNSFVLDFIENLDFPGFAEDRYVIVGVYFDDATEWQSPQQNVESLGHVLSGWDTNKILRSTVGGGNCIIIRTYSGGNNTNGQVDIDNIVLTVEV